MNSKTIHVDVELSAARAIACQRKLRNAIHPVRDALPLPLRFEIDATCKLSVEDLFTPHKLDAAQELLLRLRTLIEDVGGVPVILHTEEGEPYEIGGSELGRSIGILFNHLDEMQRNAWLVSDHIAARAVIG
ncbi:hypothetical protein [Sulfitobacter pontiacus]|uniref:hypothetical protein n=1 Tax=Sulfitobacter pontiacus TaxID=60137 RepID=UPI0030EEADF4